jgi:hypothetical protein
MLNGAKLRRFCNGSASLPAGADSYPARLITNFKGNFGVRQFGVINSGSGSGTPRLRRSVPLLFEKESSKTVCPGSTQSKIRS